MGNSLRSLCCVVFLFTGYISHAQLPIQTNANKVQSYVFSHLSELGLQAEDAADLRITDEVKSFNDRTTYVYLQQFINGIAVEEGRINAALQDGEVLLVNSDLVRKVQRFNWSNSASLNPTQGFIQALQATSGESLAKDLRWTENKKNTFELYDEGLSPDKITAELCYTLQNTPKLVWKIRYVEAKHQHAWLVMIDANSGEVVYKHDEILNCKFGERGHHHTPKASPVRPSVHQANRLMATNSYNALPLKVESPAHGNRQILVDPAHSKASPFGWHDTDGSEGAEFTITRGNNVFAQEDRNGNNGTGANVDGGAELIFDAPFTTTSSASNYIDASIINLFVWNNYMHDVWYFYGFDEAGGNFQQNTYGNGGTGGDYVFADAQDGSGTNNANFQPTTDGNRPRMQMFLWRAAASTEHLKVNSPSVIAGTYGGAIGGFGGELTEVPVVGDLVLVDDNSANPTLGCNALSNGADVNGNIALIDRGTCTFVQKIQNAQNAGAKAVIMINNVAGSPITMGGTSGSITIPSIMITREDGQKIKDELAKGKVNVSLYDSTGGGGFFTDSDFDNGVVAHEYGHGISNRLTGGPNVLCLRNQEQMGEGWSDFFSLVMTHAPSAKGEDRRGVGTYLLGQANNGNGIRPYPYSTDKTVNPVTYGDIRLNRFTAPHGVGSVWCSMLWDMYWAFIDEYGYDPDIYEGTGGNNMAMWLVMDGMKLQKCSPGFIDGRDAILQADVIRNGGKNSGLIWGVFASRGLGYSADQGSSQSKTDGTESFDLPPSFASYSIDKMGPSSADAGDTITYKLVVKNTGGEVLKNLAIRDSLGLEGSYIDDNGCGFSQNGQILTATLTDLAVGDSFTCTYRVVIGEQYGGEVLINDDAEEDNEQWTVGGSGGAGDWDRVMTRSNNGQYSWFCSDPDSESDRWIEAEVDLSQATEPFLTFSHYYNTETGWDGAVVEVKNGNAWVDLGPFMVSNGYNMNIEVNPASAISGRRAFSGNSGAFLATVVDLSTFVGQKRSIRFRMVSDGAAAGEGWYVDDIELWSNFDLLTNKASAQVVDLKSSISTTATTIYNIPERDTSDNPDTVVVLPEPHPEGLYFFPNPASEMLTIRLSSERQRKIDLIMYDAVGRKLWEGDVRSHKDTQLRVDHLQSGIYVFEVNDEGEISSVKVVVH